MSLAKSLLVGLLVVGAAVGGAVYVHPDGAGGVAALFGIDGVFEMRSSHPRDTGAAPTRNTSASPTDQLRDADHAFDAGDFSGAATFYMVAGALATDDSLRARAQKGTYNSVLAWAMTDSPPAPDFGGRTARDRLTELTTRARTAGTEDAWLDVALFAKAAGLDTEAPQAVTAALDLAVAGGAVERRITAALPRADAKERAIREALALRGLKVAPSTAVAAAGLHHPEAADEGPSGIGGKAVIGSIRVPFGAFDAAMRARLERAVVAEREGLEHFAAAGPDGTKRSYHRSEALKLLREARDAYNDALEMDPDSRAAEARMRQVMRALGQLNKEVVTGE